jgi:hypothetical protein
MRANSQIDILFYVECRSLNNCTLYGHAAGDKNTACKHVAAIKRQYLNRSPTFDACSFRLEKIRTRFNVNMLKGLKIVNGDEAAPQRVAFRIIIILV